MKHEIATAVVFFSQLLQKDNDPERIAQFRQILADGLARRFAAHWHADRPYLGSGFRCLRSVSTDRLDPLLRQV